MNINKLIKQKKTFEKSILTNKVNLKIEILKGILDFIIKDFDSAITLPLDYEEIYLHYYGEDLQDEFDDERYSRRENFLEIYDYEDVLSDSTFNNINKYLKNIGNETIRSIFGKESLNFQFNTEIKSFLSVEVDFD